MHKQNQKTNSTLRKKPWNRVNMPVFSISSAAGNEKNMHILTYVTPVSMQPKRFVCGIYHGTKTLELVEKSETFVLQLLAEHQYPLVKLLGKQSGKKINKIARLEKIGAITTWHEFSVLKDCLAVMLLQTRESFEGGDHRVFLCDVLAYHNLNPGEPLTLDHLREAKIISV